jgi:hypothetical protein
VPVDAVTIEEVFDTMLECVHGDADAIVNDLRDAVAGITTPDPLDLLRVRKAAEPHSATATPRRFWLKAGTITLLPRYHLT